MNEDFFYQFDYYIGICVQQTGNSISAISRTEDKFRLDFHWENRLTSYRLLMVELEKFIRKTTETHVKNGKPNVPKYCHFYVFTKDKILKDTIDRLTVTCEGAGILLNSSELQCPPEIALNLILTSINDQVLSINKNIDLEKILKDLGEVNLEENASILPTTKSLMFSLGEVAYCEIMGSLPIVFSAHSMQNYCQVLEGIQEDLGRRYDR